MIRAIIFDCYGVLVGRGFPAAYAEAGGDLKRDEGFLHHMLDAVSLGKFSSEEFHQEIADRIGISVGEWLEVYKDVMLPNEKLFDYIRTELKGKYKIGLLSNANHGSVEEKLTQEQLGLFDVRVISADVGMIKPDPKIYQLAAERLDVDTNECVFTDDNELYVTAAKEQGMQAFLYHDLAGFKDQLKTTLA